MSVIGVLLMVASLSSASIQPAVDNVYGNAFELGAGNTTIFDGALTEAEFLNRVYATDAQQAELMFWSQNNPNGWNLGLTAGATWADAAATFKIVAPTGMTFSGGFIELVARNSWTSLQPSLIACSAYGNNGWGYVDAFGTVYDYDNHSMSGDWQTGVWTVDVPTGVSEFYLVVVAYPDYKDVWCQDMKAWNVAVVPEPMTIGMLVFGGVAALIRRK
jgi:hypothetical protein